MSTGLNLKQPDVTESAGETPLYQRIRAHIREQIASGAYAVDDRLPSEPALAAQFSTTRATVQHALRQLEYEGLVLRQPGRGTFVGRGRVETPVVPTRLLSFEEQIGERGSTVTYRLLGFSRVEADEEAAARLNVPVGSPLFHMERLRLLDGLIFCLEDRLIPGRIGGAITMDALHRFSIHHIIQSVLGLAITRNDVSIRADVASARIAKCLEIKRGSPLLVREHLLSGADGQPILYGEALYRAEFRFNYTMDPRRPADPLRFSSDVKR